MNTYIITFYSHFSAIGFHKAIKKTGIQANLMPIPRHLSSSCGTCVRAKLSDNENVVFEDYDGIEKVFQMDGECMDLIYEP